MEAYTHQKQIKRIHESRHGEERQDHLMSYLLVHGVAVAMENYLPILMPDSICSVVP